MENQQIKTDTRERSIIQRGTAGQWYIAKADNPSLAWSGSHWVAYNDGSPSIVCYFGSAESAGNFARHVGMEIVPALTASDVREIFRKIANRERAHGGFLTAFAEAYLLADPENEALLLPVALRFAHKYRLEGYVTEAEECKQGS